MPRQIIRTTNAPASPHFSQGVVTGGHLYVSGMVGIDPATGELAGSQIADQARQALTNCMAVLSAGGARSDDIVEVGVLLADPADFAGFNDEWARWFAENPPARYVARLGVEISGVLVSIRMTAFVVGTSSAETVAEWNEATGAQLDESTIVDALESLRAQGWLTDAPPSLTAAEIDYVEQHGGVADDRKALVKSRVSAAVREDAVERESMTVERTAELMQISASRVRHRIAEGSVYAYPSSGRGVGRRIPYWQFHGPVPVPHLATVLNSLPERFRPSDIRAFALNAGVDDPDNGVVVALLDWLRDGGDPEIALALAESEARLI